MSMQFILLLRAAAAWSASMALVPTAALALVVTAASGTGGNAIRYPGGTGIVHITMRNDTAGTIAANTLRVASTIQGGLGPVASCGGPSWTCPTGLPPTYTAALGAGQTTSVLAITLPVNYSTAITNAAQCATGGASAPCAGGLVFAYPPGTSNTVTIYASLIPAGAARWIDPGDGSWTDPMNWLGGPPIFGEGVSFNATDAGAGDHVVSDAGEWATGSDNATRSRSSAVQLHITGSIDVVGGGATHGRRRLQCGSLCVATSARH
jgi:hypothetical protein